MKTKVHDELKQHFRPEFLNRVDDVVVFPQLDRRRRSSQIVDLMIAKLDERLQRQGHGHRAHPGGQGRCWPSKGYDPVLGARPLRRTIQREIEDALSEKILFGELKPGQIVVVDVEGEGEDGSSPSPVPPRRRSPRCRRSPPWRPPAPARRVRRGLSPGRPCAPTRPTRRLTTPPLRGPVRRRFACRGTNAVRAGSARSAVVARPRPARRHDVNDDVRDGLSRWLGSQPPAHTVAHILTHIVVAAGSSTGRDGHRDERRSGRCPRRRPIFVSLGARRRDEEADQRPGRRGRRRAAWAWRPRTLSCGSTTSTGSSTPRRPAAGQGRPGLRRRVGPRADARRLRRPGHAGRGLRRARCSPPRCRTRWSRRPRRSTAGPACCTS